MSGGHRARGFGVGVLALLLLATVLKALTHAKLENGEDKRAESIGEATPDDRVERAISNEQGNANWLRFPLQRDESILYLFALVALSFVIAILLSVRSGLDIGNINPVVLAVLSAFGLLTFFVITAGWVYRGARREPARPPRSLMEIQAQVFSHGVQAVIAVLFLVGLMLTWKQASDSGMMAQVEQRRNMTERYTAAVEDLGSTAPEQQLAGIYALGQLACESEEDYLAVMDLLTAFVRTRSGPVAVGVEDARDALALQNAVRAAVIMLARTAPGSARECIDAEDLPGGHRALDLSHAYLLELLVYLEVGLIREEFEANLSFTSFQYANLAGAYLDHVDLNYANFIGANLYDAQFVRHTNVAGAQFDGANLSYADLRGADGLTMEQLRRANTFDGAMLPDYLLRELREEERILLSPTC